MACLDCTIQAGLLDLSLGSVRAGALGRPCTLHPLVGLARDYSHNVLLEFARAARKGKFQ